MKRLINVIQDLITVLYLRFELELRFKIIKLCLKILSKLSLK